MFLLLLPADVSENDVVRLFNPKLDLSEKELTKILKEAKLEEAGFKRTVESSTVTDENGKKTEKKTIYYMVKDHCTKVGFWEGVLEQRLPDDFLSSKIGSTLVREIESRIQGRSPKYCMIGLEIHVNRCLPDSENPGYQSKRRAGCGWWSDCRCQGCTNCNAVKIVY